MQCARLRHAHEKFERVRDGLVHLAFGTHGDQNRQQQHRTMCSAGQRGQQCAIRQSSLDSHSADCSAPDHTDKSRRVAQSTWAELSLTLAVIWLETCVPSAEGGLLLLSAGLQRWLASCCIQTEHVTECRYSGKPMASKPFRVVLLETLGCVAASRDAVVRLCFALKAAAQAFKTL